MPTDTALPSIAIIGAGSMGGAILQGLVRSGLATSGVTVTNRTRAKAEQLAGLEGVASIALEDRPEANAEAAASARVVLINHRLPKIQRITFLGISPSLEKNKY